MASSPGRHRTGVGSVLWAAEIPYPVMVLDGAGYVVELNDAASSLLPDVRTARPLSSPDWLTGAHHGTPIGAAGGMVGENFFSAHPSSFVSGDTAWWLVEETAYRTAVEELTAERERAGFLAEASSALSASLNLQRCMEVTARLAAEHLADAALVIAPTGAGNCRWVVACHSGRPSHSTAPGAMQDAPGLAEALRGFPPCPPGGWTPP
ncbi:hypothetical protein [Streptomyces sp. NPDC012825]|uniref:hypothetical protein n=1 Tax=Streptomyces sp. NPDC012825 TaxID=3364851 RepID=UPI0036B1B684